MYWSSRRFICKPESHLILAYLTRLVLYTMTHDIIITIISSSNNTNSILISSPSSSHQELPHPSTPAKPLNTGNSLCDEGAAGECVVATPAQGFATPLRTPSGPPPSSTHPSLYRHHHPPRRHCTSSTPHSANEQEEEEEKERTRDCPVCFSPLANRSIHKTRCNHLFHRTCLVESRAAHINGCPCCRREITPGLTPFDAIAGRNVSGRDQIISRARAARQAVMLRMQQQSRRSVNGFTSFLKVFFWGKTTEMMI